MPPWRRPFSGASRTIRICRNQFACVKKTLAKAVKNQHKFPRHRMGAARNPWRRLAVERSRYVALPRLSSSSNVTRAGRSEITLIYTNIDNEFFSSRWRSVSCGTVAVSLGSKCPMSARAIVKASRWRMELCARMQA